LRRSDDFIATTLKRINSPIQWPPRRRPLPQTPKPLPSARRAAGSPISSSAAGAYATNQAFSAPLPPALVYGVTQHAGPDSYNNDEPPGSPLAEAIELRPPPRQPVPEIESIHATESRRWHNDSGYDSIAAYPACPVAPAGSGRPSDAEPPSPYSVYEAYVPQSGRRASSSIQPTTPRTATQDMYADGASAWGPPYTPDNGYPPGSSTFPRESATSYALPLRDQTPQTSPRGSVSSGVGADGDTVALLFVLFLCMYS